MTDEAGVVTALAEGIITEAKQLRKDIEAYEAAHRRERRAYRFMGAILIAAIAVTMILIATARAGLRNTQETIELVKSCTTPTGECYKQNRSQTSNFREQLLGVVAILTDCDVSTDDLAKFRGCVKKRTELNSAASLEEVAPSNVVEATPKATPAPTP